MTGPGEDSDRGPFAGSHERFDAMTSWLESAEAAGLSHAELEDQLDTQGRDLLRQLFQDHLDLRATHEERVEVTDTDNRPHGTVEAGHRRSLTTVFGAVTIERLAYRRRGCPNLYPADGALNLPAERHSHGLRRLAAIESTRGSFEGAVDAIERATGISVGKRQVEELTAAAATDIEAFYANLERPTVEANDVVVLTVDGKGIVMRPGALRPATAKAAAAATPKLKTRLSKGEKRNRKRMATVGAVYDLTPVVRTPAQVLASHDTEPTPPAPKAKTKLFCV